MAKRKMVQYNLMKNSIAAYFAAIEIHNKPNMPYRYETVSLLIMNAWELALKSYIRKYIKGRSIYTDNDHKHTISLDKALDYVNEHCNSKQKNSFMAIKQNILKIEEYRNMITHFYCDELEPYIFMLVARSALNYVDFIKAHFNKDIMADEGLFILPLGFKLPFRPEDFLSENVAKYASSTEAQLFIREIVNVIQDLKEKGIEDSIVLGFDIYLESVKKATNSDILAAITSPEQADVAITQVKKMQFSPNATQVYQMSDDEYRSIYKYTHAELIEWCKVNILGFRQNDKFNAAKKAIAKDKNCVYERKLDNRITKSNSKKYYSEQALDRIKEYFELH